MKKYAAIFLSLLLVFLSLPSCQKQEYTDCRQLLDILTEAEISLPSGKYYSLSAKEGDDEFLSDSLISALYGSNALSKISEGWIDCSLYISFLEDPREFAIIYCKNKDYANDTARLLCARLSGIKAATDTKYSKMIEEACVSVVGNYAILIISSDSATGFKALKRSIP